MKYLNLKKHFALLAIIAFVFSACKKPDLAQPMGDAGQTLVKMLGGGSPYALIKDPVSFVNTPYTLTKGVVDIRRDIPNNTELNRTMNIVVKDDIAAVAAADPNYIILPAAWYTLQVSDNVPKVGGAGGTWTFVMKPGEFAKQIYITLPDATLLDPSALYALGFTITSADASGIITEQKTVVVEIGAKNAWDGVYAVTGPMVDVTNAAFVQWNNPAFAGDPFPAAHGGAWELHLITTGGSQVVMFDNTIWGDVFHPILNGTANSGWGSYALGVDFNPATGTIADIHNYYGEAAHGGSGPPGYVAGNTRSATLDPTGANATQGNKDILIKYFMHMPSAVPTPPSIRVTFDEKWEYVGPR